MEESLVNKSIKVSKRQVEWILGRSGSFSRFVRALIDREMGAEEARLMERVKNSGVTNVIPGPETKKAPLKWALPKG